MIFLKKLWLPMLLVTNLALGQYFGEQVLEKSFEQTDFFFKPHFLNTYGIGGFGSSAPGLIDDPLLNIQINPANMVSDSVLKSYFYLNFRNSKVIEDDPDYYYPLYDMAGGSRSLDYIWYPQYYVNTRKEMEPIISAAWFFRPFSKNGTSPTLGLTYQAIFQDEAYYDIPQDIYRSNPGYDYGGNQTAEVTDFDITDRYSGQDEMHQMGHFITLYSGFGLAQGIHAGARLSRVIFNRDGGYGSQSQWDNGWQTGYNSSNQYNISRDQAYDHWDISGGLNIRFSRLITGGFSAGYLWGTGTQHQSQTSNSFYQYGTIGQGDDWSYYYQDSFNNQSWEHDGHAKYGGLNLSAKINPNQTLNVYYRGQWENVDISLNAVTEDTSYSNYHYDYDTWRYSSESVNRVIDERTGTGSRKSWSHFVAAALQWQIGGKTRVAFGANFYSSERKTETSEPVAASRYSDYYWENTDTITDNYYATEEQKELLWDFNTRMTRVQIPVFLTYRISPAFELQFGINRNMTRWEITDETLALFDYRTTTENDNIEQRENFGERYTQPKETESEVTTSILAGLTITPSKHFNIRLLMVPNYTQTYDGMTLNEYQWWIDFYLTP